MCACYLRGGFLLLYFFINFFCFFLFFFLFLGESTEYVYVSVNI